MELTRITSIDQLEQYRDVCLQCKSGNDRVFDLRPQPHYEMWPGFFLYFFFYLITAKSICIIHVNTHVFPSSLSATPFSNPLLIFCSLDHWVVLI